MKKPAALGVNIYAGGFSLGVRDHFKIIAHLEDPKPYGAETSKKNLGVEVVPRGARGWDLEPYRNVDWIYGNPPCAAWSMSGRAVFNGADSWRVDERVERTRDHFALLKKLEPAAWAWESVQGAWLRGREFVEGLAKRARALDYSVTIVLHDAQWLGVPQVRRRFFMVCHRVEIDWQTPEPHEPITSIDALESIPRRKRGEPWWGFHEKLAPLFPSVEQGETLRKAWEREQRRRGRSLEPDHRGIVVGRPSFGHHRLRYDQPATAVVGYAKIHPIEDRCLSLTELKVLSGFPLDWEFVGTQAQQSALLARGVCPPVAEWLAGNLRRAIQRGRPSSGRYELLDLNKLPARTFDLLAPKRRMFA